MAASPINQVTPDIQSPRDQAGDVPERIRRRYLASDRHGPGVGFYIDATLDRPVFRDAGDRLSTDRNDPNVVRELVEIAQHRGWTMIQVTGSAAFRREVWTTARAAGLEVRGHKVTERDLQALARRAERATRPSDPARRAEVARAPAAPLDATTRLKVVEAVVRNRIVEPSEQDRVLAKARAKLAHWLERGDRARPPAREAPRSDRRPDPTR